MKKVLFLIPFLSSGGAERVVSIWASEMAKKGVDVHLLLFYRVANEYTLDKRVKVHTIKNTKSDYEKLTKFIKLYCLRKAFKEIKPDLVLPFISYVGIMSLIAKIMLPIKVIETVRIDPRYSPKHKTSRWLRNISILFSKKCIVQNKTQLAYFPKWIQNKIRIFPNPIADEFTKKQKIFNEKKIKKFVTVGRLEEQKNFHLLINAFSEIVKIEKDVTLRIYGVGSLHSELNKLISDFDLGEKVLLCGRTNDMVSVLKESDLFILSSDAEGMPNSLMEAMAVGLPCISTDCPSGPADLIEDGVNGFLVPVGNKQTLVNAMIKVIRNIDSSIDMGSQARKSILKKYSASTSTNDMIKFLESIN